MKNHIVLKLFSFLIILTGLLFSVIPAEAAYVRGYVRSNGTYVQPHYRSNANSTQYDNYSTKGNVNPYTGEEGHKTPEY
ncbi:MAG: hypothetical protein WC860_06600 [Candidatus Margulisiibacteriota bacterium]|jgi:hypothetical protein